MRGKYDMDTPAGYIRQQVQQFSETLIRKGVPPAIVEGFQAAFLIFVTDRLDTQLFRPIQSINDQSLADLGVGDDISHLLQQHLPGCGLVEPGCVQFLCAVLRVDKQWVGEVRCEGAFTHALYAIHANFLCAGDFSSGNVHFFVSSCFSLIRISPPPMWALLSAEEPRSNRPQ